MEETSLDLELSLVQDEMNSSDFTTSQQPPNFFVHHHQQQQQQEVALEFSAEELQAIQEINEMFESAPFFNDPSFDSTITDLADQNLNYLEYQYASGEQSFDDESIYMEEGAVYTELEDLDPNSLMMLMATDEEPSFEMEEEDDDDDESFQRVPSFVSARYAQFPQP